MTDSQKWLVLTFLLIVGGLIYLLAPILMPFVFAAMLAYLGDPITDKLEVLRFRSYQLGRTNAVVIVFILISLLLSTLLIFIVPKVEFQINQFIGKFPA